MPVRKAVRHGFYSREVPITAKLPDPLRAAHLARYFQSMAEASLALAERLDAWAGERNGQISGAISSLTRLAAELEQFSAALNADALRPSALSNLPAEDVERLIAQQRRALELALSRIALTSSALLSGEPLRADGSGISVYQQLATLMRRSKSIAQALATNLYWQRHSQDAYEDDLAARLYAALSESEDSQTP
ncbi:MAG: hypothetical protein CUN49_13130 [Candidatus Thermofonsia Clade 1 bacterium]|jgi:hypothetical protein|uniref:Uncharacterized protein n=1 Tax=Candidatus Thermofonsia Clade 1 bacterium TaxID=2364210 RepID=A0A2M8PBK3_9CHLR|nr:MAG: hypothetical protein CUN49_13130 [Candidatus Thermofonsia Clade 1 bacterium]RMF52120.1 MAG: hypothetical protein D6749_05845 [Chloroflexota bacterium]